MEYEIINIECNFSEDEIQHYIERDKKRCQEIIVSNYKSGMGIEKLEYYWEIITSRGKDKLIYGKFPEYLLK